MIRAWKGLPKPDEQRALVTRLRNELSRLQAVATNVETQLHDTSAQYATLGSELDAFRHQHGGAPSDILRKAEQHAARLREIAAATQQAAHAGNSQRCRLESTLVARLRLIEKIGYQFIGADTAEDMLEAVRKAYVQSCRTVHTYDIRRLRSELESANAMVVRLTSEIAEIDEQLNMVEQTVIAEAGIIATTLTRAYLRDTIQARRFDTVILDEASMAPIPALWIAASITDTNAVLVGDFKQLPPIVQSKHTLAEKWLGRDVFEAADLTQSDGCPPFPTILRPLFEQRRMHRAISAIPNRFIYHGQLQDGAPVSDDGSMDACYCTDNGLDAPVLLVDTETLHAWVTNAGRSGSTSRLNFLSATVCVALATQCLRPDRPPHEGRPRILIVSPYRPHADLIRLLLESEGLSGEVAAGTVHSFQGNQADIVIFDLVNDEPHWRVRLFTPSADNDTRRLVNVAVTRARQRLIVVGDSAYHVQQASNSFLGKELVPYLLERYRRVDAKAIVPAGFAARATAAQSMVQGGAVECSSARSVVTQKEFYRFLSHDIQNAKNQLVIYSPFLSQNRLGELQSVLRAAVERSIKIFVITKALQDRTRHEMANYRRLERALVQWDIRVIHKSKMHEKLVFVDDDVVWTGSLNPLSFRDTQEVMERRRSREVVKDYKETLRLEELLKEYDTGRPTCPWCGSEVIAAEGKDEPFYWRCVEDRCYSRSIGESPLLGDIVLCKKCQGEVEYGVRGAKAIWRCKGNARHYQFVKRMHLRLPKMRAIVPPAILRELDQQFRVTSDDLIDAAGCRERPVEAIEDECEGTLFDDDLVNDVETCSRNHADGVAKRASETTMYSGDGRNSGKSEISGMGAPRLSESASTGQEPSSVSSTPLERTKPSSGRESQEGGFINSSSGSSQWQRGTSGQEVFVTPGERASVVRALQQAGRSLIMWQLAQHAELPEWRMEKILPVLVDDGCVKLDRDADANRYRLPER